MRTFAHPRSNAITSQGRCHRGLPLPRLQYKCRPVSTRPLAVGPTGSSDTPAEPAVPPTEPAVSTVDPAPVSSTADPNAVVIARAEGGTWRFMVKGGGTIHKVEGVAGNYTPDTLTLGQSWGCNTVRTYNPADLPAVLPLTAPYDQRVVCGLSFSIAKYIKDSVAEEQRILAVVEQYRSDPRILCWNIGNEQEASSAFSSAGGRGDLESMKILVTGLNHVAELIKQADPLHPVMNTFIQFQSGADPPLVQLLRPGTALDALGMNCYNNATDVPSKYKEWFPEPFMKPYVITELGWWPALRGRPVEWSDTVTHERSSTDKAQHYAASYDSFNRDKSCLGHMMFRWDLGSPQEQIGAYTMPSESWHMGFTPRLQRTEVGDEMIRAWSWANVTTEGAYPPLRAPFITSPYANDASWTGISVRNGSGTNVASNEATAGSTLKELRQHNIVNAGGTPSIKRAPTQPTTWQTADGAPISGGDGQSVVDTVTVNSPPGASSCTVRFAAPPAGLAYRLHVFVEDVDAGGAVAYASWPFRVI